MTSNITCRDLRSSDLGNCDSMFPTHLHNGVNFIFLSNVVIITYCAPSSTEGAEPKQLASSDVSS